MPELRNPEDARGPQHDTLGDRVRPTFDIAVVGSGPAGLAVAAEAQAAGARVALVAPDPRARWVPTWCAFAADLPQADDSLVARCLHDAGFAHRWSSARVALDDREQIDARPYVQVDGPALQQRLLDVFAEHDGAIVSARVLDIDSASIPRTLVVEPADGEEPVVLRARHVVDCTGEAQVLGSRVAGARPTAYQTAFGLEIETDGHPWAPDQATWMDLTALQDPPSFLYALPRDGRRVFVEETALAARPLVSIDLLERRLRERLARLGVEIRAVHATERCRIPLDMPEPAGLAYGTAGGMVHPATGYLLTRVLRGARSFAEAVLDGRGARELARLRGGASRPLHLLGLDVLVEADGSELGRFFERFFAMPHARREAFLAVQPRLGPTVWSMSRLFLDAPMALKLQLAGPLFRSKRGIPPSTPPTSEVACPHS
jgi:lycopene cyclase-like protein